MLFNRRGQGGTHFLSRKFVVPLVALGAVVALVALRLFDPAPVEIARHKQVDFLQGMSPRVNAGYPVVVVVIDDESLAAHGQWPWPRSMMAQIVDSVARSGALAIGFNIMFPEPDRTSPDQIARMFPGLGDEAVAALNALPSNDSVLADSFRRGRLVAAESVSLGTSGESPGEPKTSLVTIGVDPRPSLLSLSGVTGNIPVLHEAATGIGNITLLPEWDGVIRRVPLILRHGESIRPSLALEMLRVATGEQTLAVKSDENGVTGVIIAGSLIPTDAAGRIWLRYAALDPARYVSAREILEGNVPASRFSGRLVLISATAAGLLDAKGTPIEDGMSSLEIQAQILEGVLSQSSLRRADFALMVELGAIVVSACLMFFGLPGIRPLWGFVASIPVVGGLAGGSWHLFTSSQMLLDVTYPAFANLILYTLFVSVRYVGEEAEKREVRRAFSQYLSPDLVKQLASDTKQLNLGGQIRPMSILFSDIRGFTDLSERLRDHPERITEILNRYFTSMTDRILEYRGTIDKYMGDAIMAFWNAPLDDEDHARHACEAALEMLDGLAKLNRKLEAEADERGVEFRPIDIGIGLNTGRCLVGNLGSEHRFSYSVVGDPVNLASRLEALSKRYGVKIIIGEDTRALVPDFAALELDLVRVKGKQQAVRIYGLLGLPGTEESGDFQRLAAAHERFLIAYRARDWDEARTQLASCRADRQDFSRLHALYEERIDHFTNNPPPLDWDGVFTARSK
jgi:adenylate cyclase